MWAIPCDRNSARYSYLFPCSRKNCLSTARSAELYRAHAGRTGAELPDGGQWTYEAKLDGYRCLEAKRSSGIVLWSRRGNGFTARFPQNACACEKLPPDTLIDAEVIVLDENGRCTFNGLQHKPKDHISSSMRLIF